jgi:4-alpha-glucanotransferase
MNSLSSVRLLRQLARLYGIQTAYYDVNHCRQQAPEESLLAVLQSLGAPVATLQDVPLAWRERRQQLWQRLLEPVTVVWGNELSVIQVRLPSAVAEAVLAGELILESGERKSWTWQGADLPIVEKVEIEGIPYVVKRFPLPGRLPWGYHHFRLDVSGKSRESLVIAAPLKVYIPPEGQNEKMWGVFLPLYALHTSNSWGSGDFSDLAALMDWVAGMGGNVVATLPLLATFLDEPFEPSPYAPVSRLMWNEFYLDIDKVPELQECPSAQALLASQSLQQEVKALRHSPLVDYRRQMALKRQVLEELCRHLFDSGSDLLESLRHFTKANPVVEDYACFRATAERQRAAWRSWPPPLRGGVLKEGDYNEDTKCYHLYAQWLAHQQMADISKTAQQKGLQLCLDLPLGVHPDGYDVWREHALFIPNVSVGSPPDAVFTKGQDWQFPPLHPEKVREQGYRYTIAYLRHHLRHAGILRIDHVMGLHRLFWIPRGLAASQGVYVRYPAEELYAILALESHRQGSIIVGEDLGTVSPEVRPAMRRHHLHRMYVVHYELCTSPESALRSIPPNSVASFNTHDMPPIAACWQGSDIEERRKMGLLDQTSTRAERRIRRDIKKALVTFLQNKGWLKETMVNARVILNAGLAFLSASRARVVLVNLEDLWLETRPQNVPSTRQEYPNWRRKAKYDFEKFCQIPEVLDTLRETDCLRQRGKYHSDAAKSSRQAKATTR